MPKKQQEAPEVQKSAFYATGSLIAELKVPEPLSPELLNAQQALAEKTAKEATERFVIVAAVEEARQKVAAARIAAERNAAHKLAAAAILEEKAAIAAAIREDAGIV
jgi:hypothetical protein